MTKAKRLLSEHHQYERSRWKGKRKVRKEEQALPCPESQNRPFWANSDELKF